ncbi:ATP-binding cassette domain-containing protein [Aquibacillus salsiterrae]|uniref:ATP-binding cassette domain-containing protein n=1 Tax=Aquibacillus salsiterrae TaxID=2950439 RepID=A0A9X4AG93_9BACI|nr:ATP-binding cassette domain-containing protein [Aquibacillus salsiterrae]MDC3416858.1 ATP-binding cassette domain-containing protein [Aquibacillus salsiterrae]
MLVIRVNGLAKSFKVAKRSSGLTEALKALFYRKHTIVQALQDISFSIEPGEIVGYIGPNGAGKSTTIKVMSGILVPDQGTCEIMGFTPWKNRANYVKNIGVVFGQRSQLWWDVPVIDSFELLKDIYKVSYHDYQENLTMLIDLLNLKDIIHTPVRQLSLGQRMRCEIAASLIHNPKILFLDEPTIGLDAVSKIAVRKFIQDYAKEKKVTVVLTTHDMSDIEALATRIILIGKGQLFYDGSVTTLRESYGSQKILTIDYQKSNVELDTSLQSLILSKTEERIILRVDTKTANVSKIIGQLSSQVELIDVSIEAEPIEDIIIKLYKEYQI